MPMLRDAIPDQPLIPGQVPKTILDSLKAIASISKESKKDVPTSTTSDQPVSNPTDLVNSALVVVRELRNKLNNRLTGTGSAIGDPRIRAGVIMRLEGLGPDFSGNYRVTSASHSIDTGGYRTNFEVRKEILP